MHDSPDTSTSTGTAGQPEQHDRHPHLHALTHALATAGQVYGDALAGLVTPTHPPAWQHAVEEYDREHARASEPGGTEAAR